MKAMYDLSGGKHMSGSQSVKNHAALFSIVYAVLLLCQKLVCETILVEMLANLLSSSYIWS